MFRGEYRDPETAGELYAREVKEIIEDCHKEGKKVCYDETYVETDDLG